MEVKKTRTKIVFHIDVNSAFLSWSAMERLRTGEDSVDLRTIPSAVGGDEEARHGVVLAKSTPAKKYGVTTGEPLAAAKRKCPNLKVVRPDFAVYVAQSNRLRELLSKWFQTKDANPPLIHWACTLHSRHAPRHTPQGIPIGLHRHPIQ